MSQPSCDACRNLMENAPEFVAGGVTDNVAASLMNNTGVSFHSTNCEDLKDVVDCLIGHKAQEIERFDVCDWKKFISDFFPNLYETLKAMVMNECSEWERLDSLCAQLTILGALIRGGVPNPVGIPGEWTSSGLAQLSPVSPYTDKSKWKVVLETGQASYINCYGIQECSRMISPRIRWVGDEIPGGGRAFYSMNNYKLNDIWAVWDKSQLVPSVFSEYLWTNAKIGIPFTYSKTTNFILGVELVGYTVYNGVEYNTQYKDTYGLDKILLVVRSIVGASGTVSGIGQTTGTGGPVQTISC